MRSALLATVLLVAGGMMVGCETKDEVVLLPSPSENLIAPRSLVIDAPVEREEFEGVAYWQAVLAHHPDLPQKVHRILASPAMSTCAHAHLPVVVHAGPAPSSTGTVDLIITDLDRVALSRLAALLEDLPYRAAELGLDLPMTSRSPDAHRIIVLGASGLASITGPDNDRRNVRVMPQHFERPTQITVHLFGERGQDIVSLLPDPVIYVRGDAPQPRATLRPEMSVLIAGTLRGASATLMAFLHDRAAPPASSPSPAILARNARDAYVEQRLRQHRADAIRQRRPNRTAPTITGASHTPNWQPARSSGTSRRPS